MPAVSDSPIDPGAAPRVFPRRVSLVWLLGRVPLLLVVLWTLRKPLLDVIERAFGIAGITMFVIERASTLVTRGSVVAVVVLALTVLGLRTRRYEWSIGLGSLVLAGFVAGLGGSWPLWLASSLLLATNWAPDRVLAWVGLTPRRTPPLLFAAPVVVELLFVSRYAGLVLARWQQRTWVRPVAPALLGSLPAAGLIALLLPAAALVPLEQQAHASADVRAFARVDFNGLAYDAAHQRLLATGHGQEYLLAYDVNQLDAEPLVAQTDSGGAQGLELDPVHGEIFVYYADVDGVQVFDAASLALKEVVPAHDVSPGDPWVAYEPITRSLLVASEADQQTGRPLVVVDRVTGHTRDERNEETGNLLVHPNAPRVYMSFFRRVAGVIAYDVAKGAIVARAETDARMDRMAFDTKHGELLIASPAEGRIQRFDADTLAPRGAFPAIFGVRVIAIDVARDVMLVGSLASGKVALLGLSDHAIKRSWYLGPWLRSIVIAPERGVAYVSAQDALYELRYVTGE